MAAATANSPFGDAEYDAQLRSVLAAVEAEVDRLLQADVVDIDAERSGGLLELRFPNGQSIVINGQPPLRELWLAWPAGGHHFRFSAGHWVDTKSGAEFYAVLSTAAGELAGKPLTFVA